MNDALGSPQSVAVLGATSDIARATVRELVARRARRLVLAARDRNRLKEVAGEARDLGATEVTEVVFDAREVDSHPAVVQQVFGGGDIDLVLFAFGALGNQRSHENDPVGAAGLVTTNYTAAVSLGLACAGRLKEQGHGVMVALSSVAGQRARKTNFIYGSAKAGMDAFFQGLADSLYGTGVRVMVVRPGFVKTKMTRGAKPMPGAVSAPDVARQIVKGLQTGAHTIWVPGKLRWVMAVICHLPRAVFRRLPF